MGELPKSGQPLMRDWRAWLILSLVLLLGGVVAVELPNVLAIRSLKDSGCRIVHLDRMPLLINGALRSPRLLVEDRLPAAIARALPDEALVRVKHLMARDSQDLEPCRQFRTLESMEMTIHDPARVDWEQISQLTSLKRITLVLHVPLSAQVAVLRRLPHLESLTIEAPDIPEDVLLELSKMTHVKELTVYSPVIQDLSPAINRLQSQKHVTLRMWDWQTPEGKKKFDPDDEFGVEADSHESTAATASPCPD